MSERKRKVVVGIGEILAGDNGIGKHVVRLVKNKFGSHPDVEFIEAGTVGADIEQLIEESSHLLVLDAADMGRIPGTIIEFERHDIELFGGLRLLPHQIEFHNVLEHAGNHGRLPEHLHFIGMQPNFFTPGFELSREAQAALPDMLQRASSVLHSWEHMYEPSLT